MEDGHGTTLVRSGPPVPPIDPRIRARRIEVRRGAGRRRLQRLADAGVVVAVALGFLAALWSPLLDVDEVEVTGAPRTGAELVREAAGVQPGDQLVTVDLGEVGRRVTALPWVAQVALRRGIDGVVAIEVTERTPVASVTTDAGVLVVDRQGRLLGPAGDAPDLAGLPRLVGIDATATPGRYLPAAADDLVAMAARLVDALPGAIVTLEGPELVAGLAQGGSVRFGDATQLDAKVRSLRTVLDQVDLACLAVLDLRLPGSPVLTREEGCS